MITAEAAIESFFRNRAIELGLPDDAAWRAADRANAASQPERAQMMNGAEATIRAELAVVENPEAAIRASTRR